MALSWLAERSDAAKHAVHVIPMILSRSKQRLSREATNYMEKVDLPIGDKLVHLDPLLEQGIGWGIFYDSDSPRARDVCRRYAAATDDPKLRDNLAASLCRLGLEKQDVELVQQVLRSAHRTRLLWALEDAPHLPAQLRVDLTAVFDEQPMDAPWDDDYYARAALLNHR